MREYTVVFGVGVDVLTQRVNEQINAGWQPLGGVSVTTNSELVPGGVVVTLWQAMVR